MLPLYPTPASVQLCARSIASEPGWAWAEVGASTAMTAAAIPVAMARLVTGPPFVCGLNPGSWVSHPATVRLAHQRLRQAEGGVLEQLTEQERKIFDLIGEGHSNRQIAERMFLAEKTIKNYVSNILAKLGMDRRTEAAAFAARLEERERQRFT